MSETSTAPRIGFIGAGRVAAGLALAVTAAGGSVTAVASRTRASADRLAAMLPDCVGTDISTALEACDLVLLTVPDTAIAETCAGIAFRSRHSVVHCSGATEISALASAAEAGALTGGFHPMQSFTDPKAAAKSLAGCTVTIEATGPLEAQLTDLATQLGCRVNRLPSGQRALYHASAGYGSQFINVLLAETASLWRGWGATEDDVIAALLPMIRGTLASVETAGIAGGMPGPVSRGDVATVAAHLDALGNASDPSRSFYAAHCTRTVDLAEAAGRIDAETAAHLRAILAP